jgi:acetylornithine deacetylase
MLGRLVGAGAPIREAFTRAVGKRAELVEILCLPPIRFTTVDGMPTTVVSFTTDVPVFGKTWGEPLLLGPGSIHVAHTSEERISKRELSDAVEMYANVVKKLLAKN